MIHAPCGYGKTTYVKNPDGLLAAINKRKAELGDKSPFTLENVLMLVPRTAIREQQDYGDVLVKTYHSFLTDKKVDIDKVKVLVCDEAHCPYDEIYAEQYENYFRFLETAGSRIIKIFLTATPDSLKEFHEVQYEEINIGTIPPKYFANEIFISLSGSLSGVLDTYAPSLGPTRKALIFLISSKKSEAKCVEWNQKWSYVGKADFQISQYSNQTNKDGKPLKDLMNYDARRTILDTGCLPQEVVSQFLNGAFEVGVNFYDENLKLVLIQGFNPDSIVQQIGRVRKDTELVVVVLDIYGARKAISDQEKMYAARVEFDKLDTSDIAGRASRLTQLYYKQLSGDFPCVIKKIDKDHFEWSRRGWNSVNNNAYWGQMALNYKKCQGDSISWKEEWISAFGYRDFDWNLLSKPAMPNADFYKNLLRPYSRTEPKIVNFNKTGEVAREIRNDNWVERFKEEGKEWLDKKLFKEEQDELVEEWGCKFTGSQKKDLKIKGILDILEKSGKYKIKRGQTENKKTGQKCVRYVQISAV